jgi:ubiquitin-protein ligase
MSVRIRRLRADYEQLREGLREHPAISIRGVSGSPPERYQIEFKLRSLAESAEGEVRERCQHVAEIFLTLAYPRQAPQCRMLTPVFHPNIAPHAICIGDHWAAGESLLQLIVRIGEMLAYQSYNTKSPLNGAAARWVDENQGQVPTDARDLTPQTWTEAGSDAPQEDRCANCAGGGDLITCSHGHQVCASCVVECTRCHQTVCLLCKPETCCQCGRLICSECRTSCPQCRRPVCHEHLGPCQVCGQDGCEDCSIACARCQRRLCLAHVRQCARCQITLCQEHGQVCTGCGKSFCTEHIDQQHRRCPACVAQLAAQPQPAPAPAAPRIYQCRSCQTQMRIGSEHLGLSLKCPTCGTIFTVAP